MANENIRKAAKENNIFLWQIADELGISEFTLIRRLRHPLNDDEQEFILQTIKKIKNER